MKGFSHAFKCLMPYLGHAGDITFDTFSTHSHKDIMLWYALKMLSLFKNNNNNNNNKPVLSI